LATITGAQRRRLVASSIAIILAAATMAPATTDARGGGGFGGGHGGGHGGPSGGHTHFGAGAFQNTGPAIPGPATVRAFPSASHPSPSASRVSHMSFAHRLPLHHTHAIGSHFATLGYDGVWLDNYTYAPTVLVQQPAITVLLPAAQSRAPSVKTPSAARQGILVVRGDTKSYVTFAGGKPG